MACHFPYDVACQFLCDQKFQLAFNEFYTSYDRHKLIDTEVSYLVFVREELVTFPETHYILRNLRCANRPPILGLAEYWLQMGGLSFQSLRKWMILLGLI